MRRPPAGERLVAELGDPPALAELVERRGIGLAVEQSEIAEIPGNRRMRPRHAAPRQLDRGHRAACGKTHLHRQLRRSFAVRLHRAGALPVIDPDRVAQLCVIEAGQHRETRGGAESAGIGRPEEPHRRARAQAQRRRDIDAQRQRRGSGERRRRRLPAPPIRGAPASTAAIGWTTAASCTQSNSWRVDLIGVEHRRVHERQLFAAAEHRRLRRTADAGEHVEDLAAPRRLCSRLFRPPAYRR